MSAPHTDECMLDLPRPRPVPAADRLLAFPTGHRAATAWPDQDLAHRHDGLVVWTATSSRPHAAVTLAFRRPDSQAASLALAGEEPTRTHLAPRAAWHLADRVTTRDLSGGVPATNTVLPDSSANQVSGPHLVTAGSATGALTDAAEHVPAGVCSQIAVALATSPLSITVKYRHAEVFGNPVGDTLAGPTPRVAAHSARDTG